MNKMKAVYPLGSLNEIRTALRKRTVQSAIYKNQTEAGSRQTTELLAYVGFMSEDECLAFLNSVREAPFIPNINLMWTQQVVEYLMLDGAEHFKKYADRMEKAESCVEKRCKDEELSYSTKYVQNHVGEEYWHLLPKGWSAKYYRPSTILKLAIGFAGWLPINDFCKHIAEKLFIKAADLEDCLTPTTKLPPALPALPKQEKVRVKKNEIVLKDFPEGSHIAIDVPKPEQPLVPKVIEIPKVAEVPKRRRNPIVTVQPMFAAENDRKKPTQKQSREIDAIIKARYKGFGGTDSSLQLSEATGISERAVRSRIHRIKLRSGQKIEPMRKITPEFLESIKARLSGFGGSENAVSLAKELGVHYSTVYNWAKKIRASMDAPTTERAVSAGS